MSNTFDKGVASAATGSGLVFLRQGRAHTTKLNNCATGTPTPTPTLTEPEETAPEGDLGNRGKIRAAKIYSRSGEEENSHGYPASRRG